MNYFVSSFPNALIKKFYSNYIHFLSEEKQHTSFFFVFRKIFLKNMLLSKNLLSVKNYTMSHNTQCTFFLLKTNHLKDNMVGLPWWFSGWDSVLSMQGAQVWSLLRELRFPHAMRHGKKIRRKKKVPWQKRKNTGFRVLVSEENWLTELMPKIGIMFQISNGYYRDQVRSHRHRAQTSVYQ